MRTVVVAPNSVMERHATGKLLRKDGSESHYHLISDSSGRMYLLENDRPEFEGAMVSRMQMQTATFAVDDDLEAVFNDILHLTDVALTKSGMRAIIRAIDHLLSNGEACSVNAVRLFIDEPVKLNLVVGV